MPPFLRQGLHAVMVWRVGSATCCCYVLLVLQLSGSEMLEILHKIPGR